jgi:hypothetical protein
MAQKLKIKRAMLVYQAGLANVFAVETFNLSQYDLTNQYQDRRRLLQADFRACENFARGLAAAGIFVTTAHCNMTGDITNQTWSEDLDEAPFSECFRPVVAMTEGGTK